MSYTSFSFMLFLAAVAFVYYVIPKRFQWVVLLVASYAFYLSGGWKPFLFILGTTFVTYVAGRLMQRVRDKYKEELRKLGAEITKEQKKAMKKATADKVHRIQVIAVLIDLAVLALVKYSNFVIGNFNSMFDLFHYDAELPLINIVVPLGISFYTFQSMGYLIDIGRGKYAAETHLGRFALFVSFFPSIVQGPINRYDDLGEQFKVPHRLEYQNIKFGVQLMLWGLFKKLVIADRAVAIVGSVFSDNYTKYPGSVFVFGMFVYAIQIYCDFSGGIDITRGAAQVLAINLPQNFERPYFSQSVAEYWRRWHITLGSWMRDYVFYPVMLSGPVTKVGKFFRSRGMTNVAKRVPSVVTPFVVFFLIGIWHGASWKYVAFGLYNATIVASGVALAPTFDKLTQLLHINTEVFSWKLFRIVRTFMILGISKVLVRAPGLKAAFNMIKSIVTDFDPFYLLEEGKITSFGVDEKNLLLLCVAVLILFGVSVLQESGIKMRETIARQNIMFRWCLYMGIIIVILIFGMYGPSYNAVDFIYQAY